MQHLCSWAGLVGTLACKLSSAAMWIWRERGTTSTIITKHAKGKSSYEPMLDGGSVIRTMARVGKRVEIET